MKGPKTIQVVNGLFSTALGDTTPLVMSDFDGELWLEITVGSGVLPRQKLMGSPYALSLAPGTGIQGNVGFNQNLLTINNNSHGRKGGVPCISGKS
jgi:hypothetical protein